MTKCEDGRHNVVMLFWLKIVIVNCLMDTVIMQYILYVLYIYTQYIAHIFIVFIMFLHNSF